MPAQGEYNQFRRLIGDFGVNEISDSILKSYLDDATFELTANLVDAITGLPSVFTNFDDIVENYHPEIIYKAAINWWWDRASKLTERHSQTVGQASQSASEKWQRAIQMIEHLTVIYNDIEQLADYSQISTGNLSRFSKGTLTRLGGRREEDALKPG